LSDLPAIIVLSTVVLNIVVVAIATADEGISLRTYGCVGVFGEDRRFSDDYDCSAHGTLTLFLSIYHLRLACQQLTRR
jgi:hypothetical protein